jgi:hypothetical protein
MKKSFARVALWLALAAAVWLAAVVATIWLAA